MRVTSPFQCDHFLWMLGSMLAQLSTFGFYSRMCISISATMKILSYTVMFCVFKVTASGD